MEGRLFVVSILCFTLPASKGLRFASYYLDEMVLQRHVESTVWGFDALLPNLESSLDCIASDGQQMPLKRITTHLKDKDVWELRLPAFEGGTVCDIKVYNEDNTIVLKKVVFGDVWLCSGQSNMHFNTIRTR